MRLRLDSEQEYDDCVLLGRGPGDLYYERVKREIPMRYLLDDGYGPPAWDYLVEWRAVRIWAGLAGLIGRLASRSVLMRGGTVEPVVEPGTLAVLDAERERVLSTIVVDEVHSR